MASQKKLQARFIEPMLLLRTDRLPEGANWLYEIKLDGYRALAIKTSCKVQLRSRNDNDFSLQYPGITKALRTVTSIADAAVALHHDRHIAIRRSGWDQERDLGGTD